MLWLEIGTGLAVMGFVYGIMRNFKSDIKEQINAIAIRQDDLDRRIFFLATGKTLREAILEEKIRRGKE